MSSPNGLRSPTMRDLEGAGYLIEISCPDCRHHAFVRPTEVLTQPPKRNPTLAYVQRQLICSACSEPAELVSAAPGERRRVRKRFGRRPGANLVPTA